MLADTLAVFTLAERFTAVGADAVLPAVTLEVPGTAALGGTVIDLAFLTAEMTAAHGMKSVILIISAFRAGA